MTFSLKRRSRSSSDGLELQLVIEAAVLEGRRHLRRHRLEQRHVLAVERLAALLAAERHHGNRPFLGDAGDEAMDAELLPMADFLDGEAPHRERLVEVDGLPAADPVADARGGVERRQRTEEADRAGRHEVARRLVGDRGQQQTHAIEDQRVDDAIDEALAQPLQVEVGVQLAGKGDQGAPVVVAIAVVGAVEQRLDRVLDERRQQHHDQRGEHRHDRVRLAAGVGEHLAGQLEQHGVDGRDGGDRRGVDDRALDDHLDVHEAIADDRGGEGQRQEAERNGQEAELRAGVEPGRPRQPVAGQERHAADHGAADDPAQLAARGHRADPPQAREP